MKKFTLFFLLGLSFWSRGVFSQLTFTINPAQLCNGANVATGVITNTQALVVSYTWVAIGAGTCNPTFTAVPTGSTCYFNFPCTGVYTINCFGYNASSVNIGVYSTTVYVNPAPVVTASILTNASPACAGSSYTLFASGGISYTVAGGPVIVPGIPFVPTTSGCYTVFGTNISGCTSNPVVACYSVQPTVSVGGLGFICTGGTATLTASGASSYTWQPGAIIGSNVVVSPPSTTCFTVTGVSSNGCSSSAVKCVTVGSSPAVIAIASPSIVCLGNSSTLSAGGALTYTWIPSGLTGPNVVVTPTVSTVYTVMGSAGSACTGTASIVVLVNPNPIINISASTPTVCPGGSATLAATGGLTYTWSVGAMTSSIFVSPLVSTCYSVMGANANGCMAMAVRCITVTSTPAASITSSAGGSFVCEGSSITFTANAPGAVSYSWSGGSMSPTYSMIAGAWTNTNTFIAQTVSALYLGGCISTTTFAPWAQTFSCSNVWPGDANRDGVVSSTDVFELGLANNVTGPARTPTSNAYTSQYAGHWTGLISTGWNRNHADCNGDGTINANDTVAINNNFSLTHTFRINNNSSANSDISLIAPANVISGQWNKADVMLGDVSSPINQLYGVAFDLSIDQSLLDNNAAYLLYTPSFFNAGNQNVQFRKNDLGNGKVYAASVRVNGSNVSGNGKIGEFWFKLSPTAPNNAVLNLSVGNAVKIGNTGPPVGITGGTTSAVVNVSTVSLNENSAISKNLSLYPNPASNQLTLLNSSGQSASYSIVDVLGREVMKGEFSANKTIDIASLPQGAFFVRFESAGQTSFKKLVIEKR